MWLKVTQVFLQSSSLELQLQIYAATDPVLTAENEASVATHAYVSHYAIPKLENYHEVHTKEALATDCAVHGCYLTQCLSVSYQLCIIYHWQSINTVLIVESEMQSLLPSYNLLSVQTFC